MKKKTFFTIVVAIFIFVFGLKDVSLAQKPQQDKSVSQQQSPQGETYVQGNMRIDAKTGTPVAIYRLNYGPLSGTPEEMARQYLSENHQLFKMTPDLSELITDKVQQSPAGSHVRFYQSVQNIPVFGSDVVVSINKQNKIVR